jgi:hypothetical protein
MCTFLERNEFNRTAKRDSATSRKGAQKGAQPRSFGNRQIIPSGSGSEHPLGGVACDLCRSR